MGSISEGGSTNWSDLASAKNGYTFRKPTLHKKFTWFPRKTVNKTWVWGSCYAYHKYYRNGSDLYYVSNEDALEGVLTEMYRMTD